MRVSGVMNAAVVTASCVVLAACNAPARSPIVGGSTMAGQAGQAGALAPSPVAPTTMAGAGGFPSASPSVQPVMPMQRVSERSTTSVSADGRSTVTRTTRTSFGFNMGPMAGAAGGPRHANARSPNVVGSWRATTSSSFGSRNASACNVLLYGGGFEQGGRASSAGCAFGGPLHGLTSWRMDQGRLQLMRGNFVSLSLDPLGQNRFDGVGPLRTTITLSR